MDASPFEEYDVEKLNAEYAIVIVGGRTLILREDPEADDSERVQFMSKDSFLLWFQNRMALRADKKGDLKPVGIGVLWLRDPKRRQYRGIEFAPAPPGQDAGRAGYYNLWRGYEVGPSASGSCKLLLDHIWCNIAGENERIFDWVIGFFAWIIQRPCERSGVSLVLRGKQGTGKSTLGDIVGSLFAPHYILADDSRYIIGNFNAHMASCLLLQADEGFWAGDKDAEGRLKGLITSKVQMIEKKGIDPIKLPNRVNLVISSNSDWVVPAGMEERRFCVLDVSEDHMQDRDYFAALYDEIGNGGREAFLHYLMNFDLSQVKLWEIPATEALYEQKLRGLDPEQGFWFQRLLDGSQLAGDDVWHEFASSKAVVDGYLRHAERIGIRRRSDETILMTKLKRLIPKLGARKRRYVTGENGEAVRAWGYMYPSLKVCRDHFSQLMGWEIEWGEDEGAGGP